MNDLPAKPGGKVSFGAGIYVREPNGNIGHNICCDEQRMPSRLKARDLADKKILCGPSTEPFSTGRNSKVGVEYVPLNGNKGTSQCSQWLP